ncbi:hypothetical protein C455_06521 [Haloferax larsenii JCM 13917]|nr:hypothetical protein C455_06521 [Haloferax larsenii JCM 13917]
MSKGHQTELTLTKMNMQAFAYLRPPQNLLVLKLTLKYALAQSSPKTKWRKVMAFILNQFVSKLLLII